MQREGSTGESEGWNDPQGEEGSVDESEAWDGPQRESEGWDSPQRESEAWDSPQREQEDPMGESEGWDGLQREQDEPMDQFCSSCNQKKPLIDFGRFLTCNACRQRNTKANRARYIRQKALLNNKSS